MARMTALLAVAAVAGAAFADTSMAAGEMVFDVAALAVGDTVGGTTISVNRDTVFFELYYVDTECGPYEYVFETDGKALVVRRVLVEGGACDRDSEIIYAVRGRMAGVPAGRYEFRLMGVYEEGEELLFAELVDVPGRK